MCARRTRLGMVALATIALAASCGAEPSPSPTAPSVAPSDAAVTTPAPARSPRVPPSSLPSVAPTATASADLAGCPTGWDSPTHVVAPGGTTYDAVADGVGDDGRPACSLIASTIRGVPGTGWSLRLDSPLERVMLGEGDTLFVLLVHATMGGFVDAPRPSRLLVVGPEGIRADVATAWNLDNAPSGTMYLRSQEVAPDGSARTSSLAALGRDGVPMKGWPYTVSGDLGWPAFGSDGTAYLTQSTAQGYALTGLAPDGMARPGWPVAIPGEVPWTWTGLRSPTIADDGSLYDAFANGIYWIGADARPKPGWPYVMPRGMRTASQEHFGLDTPAFRPLIAADGTMYLPATHDVTPIAHVEILCLRPDATACPGWPARQPEGWLASEFALGAAGVALLKLGRLAGDRASWRNVTIRPDGTQLARVIVGDTMSELADAYGITLAALLAANPQVADPSLIRPGDELVIPAG